MPWFFVLIVAGTVFLAQNFGISPVLPPAAWIVVFADLSGLFFTSYFLNGVQHWGWLFPACVMGALALTIMLSEAGVRNAALGALVPASITVPFVVAYALDRRNNWWGLIPAGMMVVLTMVIVLTGWLSGDAMAIFMMVGFAVPFLAVYLAGNYSEAGALDLYGDQYGLPRIVSGANSLWYRGYGEPDPETVIVVGFESQYAGHFFKSCSYRGIVTNAYSVKNEETTHHTGLYVCREPRRPWPEMWQEMQWYQ